MKRALIITYYWPPSGGSGVQRWLKFAKYLPQYGWEPVIYTPLNPEANTVDEALLRQRFGSRTVSIRPCSAAGKTLLMGESTLRPI